MPKTKTHSGAKKRFTITGTGKVKHEKPYHSHILTHKTQKRKRSLRQSAILSPRDAHKIKYLLGQ